jgi:quinol monooxygenase YgiN
MYIIVKRKLKDYDSWRKIVADANDVRKTYGSKGGTVYRSATDPNEVYLIFDWDDRKPYIDYFNRPDVQKALADSGTTEIVEVSDAFYMEE